MKWTRQQAIDFGFTAAETERYVVWPGQACSYMIGELNLPNPTRRHFLDFVTHFCVALHVILSSHQRGVNDLPSYRERQYH